MLEPASVDHFDATTANAYGAQAFRIPIGTLRDWEQHRAEPDACAKAYLAVIAAEPDVVRAALARSA